MWLALISVFILGGIAYKLFFSNSKNIFKEHSIREIDITPAVTKLDLFLTRKGMAEGDSYAYKVMGSEKYCGIREMGAQMILIKDMELIKKIFIKDFEHFPNRREIFSDDEMAFKKMLPSLNGEEWKGVRTSMSPIFTTGKIRRMMEFFNLVGKEWIESFKEKSQANKSSSNSNGFVVINALQSASQYVTDVIGHAVFGMDTGTIKDPNSTFMKQGSKLVDFTKWQMMKFALTMTLPKVTKLLRLTIMDGEAMDFFERIVDQGLKARMEGGETATRNDFLQLMVEAKKGELKGEGKDEPSSFEKEAQIEGNKSTIEKKQWFTQQIMIYQSMSFFFAGFRSTSDTITFTTYALAVHQDVQDRLRKEVEDAKIVKEDGSIDYDDLSTLVYMDMVICEVLRKFSTAGRIERQCVRDYKDSETGLFVPKGTTVIIPVSAIHNDKQYYDNPERFDPEHFSPNKKALRSPYAFLAFGMGPRNCLGMRFALMKMKAAIALLVHNFRIVPTNKTPVPMTGKWTGLIFFPPKNLELKLIPLNK